MKATGLKYKKNPSAWGVVRNLAKSAPLAGVPALDGWLGIVDVRSAFRHPLFLSKNKKIANQV